jgi:predicted nucleic acid-binding protein
MRTAVDSNVLLDVFLPDPKHLECSLAALENASLQGSVVACEVVAAEVAGQFERLEEALETLGKVGVQLMSTEFTAAYNAGRRWREYRRRGGRRERMVADFLVAAHAIACADALLTRDRGYYRTYFPQLKIIEP